MASTNKTTNLDLPQWSLQDKPEMADFNDANAKVDVAVNTNKADLVAHKAGNATQETLGHIKLMENFINGTLQNGWSGDYIRYAKNDLGTKFIVASNLKTGTITEGTIITTLPIGYRPYTNSAVAAMDDWGQIRHFRVQSDGTVRVPGTANLSAERSYHLVGTFF